MMRFLIWLGLVKQVERSHYCDWPKKGEPLRISRTILPTGGYINRIEADKQNYSQTLIKI